MLVEEGKMIGLWVFFGWGDREVGFGDVGGRLRQTVHWDEIANRLRLYWCSVTGTSCLLALGGRIGTAF